MDLEKEREKQIGSFRADIVCKDQNDDFVLIENQFGTSDHNHLGKILTYAPGIPYTGTGIFTSIWISEKFRDEHIAALNYLNDNTDRNLNFWGLEMKVFKVDNSNPVISFTAVSKPNIFSNKAPNNDKEKESNLFSREYWEGFINYFSKNPKNLDTRQFISISERTPTHYNGFFFSIGNKDIKIRLGFNTQPKNSHIRVELSISNNENRLKYFEKLKEQQDKIDDEIREIDDEICLKWEDGNLDNKVPKILTSCEADPKNKEDWENQFKWLTEKTKAFYSVFEPRIKKL